MEKLVSPLVADGLFSHIFCEVGSLTEPRDVLRFQRFSDQGRIFDLASLTKALVTGPLLVRAGISNHVDLNTWLSDFVTVHRSLARLKIGDILNHSAGLRPWINLYVNRLYKQALGEPVSDRDQVLNALFARDDLLALDGRDQHVDRYSDVGYILLGRGLELVSSQPVSTALSAMLVDVGYVSPPQELGFLDQLPKNREAFIPSGYCHVRGRMLRGEVYDENCASLGGASGHCGLFGSGEALSDYLRRLFGSSIGKELLVCGAANNPTGMRRGDDAASSAFAQGRAVGHYGFTGTAFWIDPKTLGYVILLTNRTISGRLSKRIMPFRRSVFALADESLKKSRT